MADHEKPARDNRANQLNPTRPEFYRSRGYPPAEAERLASHSKPILDNRSRQLNPQDAQRLASAPLRASSPPSGHRRQQ